MKASKKNPFGKFSDKNSKSINKPNLFSRKKKNRDNKVEEDSMAETPKIEKKFKMTKPDFMKDKERVGSRPVKPVKVEKFGRQREEDNRESVRESVSFKPNLRIKKQADLKIKPDEDDMDFKDDFDDSFGEGDKYDFEFDNDMDKNEEYKTEIAFEVKPLTQRKKVLIDSSRLEVQKRKVYTVKRVIEFKIEKYDMFELSASSHYQNYLKKLTDGKIKNSGEQTNEENSDVQIQTDAGTPVDYSCQFPDVNFYDVELDETTQEKKLGEFLKSNIEFFEQVLQKRSVSKREEKDKSQLVIPDTMKSSCTEMILDKRCVLQNLKNQAFSLVHIMKSKLPYPYSKSDMIIEYRNWKPIRVFASQDRVKSIASEYDSGLLAAGDQNGGIFVYKANVKHEKLSEVIGLPVFTPDAMGEVTENKTHDSLITQVAFYSSNEVYSLDQNGKLIYWQISENENTTKLVALNSFELGVSGFFKIDEKSEKIYATENDNMVIFSRYINASTKKAISTSPHAIGHISCFFKTESGIVITGFSDGELRFYMDSHSESVLKLSNFTENEIVLCFPGNYAKMDRVTRKITIYESLSQIHILDNSGKMFIFNLEDDLTNPEKSMDILGVDGGRVVDSFYNLQTSMVHLIFQKESNLFFKKFDMKSYKKPIKKISQLNSKNQKITNILKLSFVN